MVEESLEAVVNNDEARLAIEALVEEVEPVVEQQLDPKTYESTSYSIDVGSYESSYDGKAYYELSDDNTASTTAVNEHYHEVLQDAQEVASCIKHASVTNNTYVEAQIDFNVREKKNSIKLFSPATWLVMYDGKLIFN
ncbi:hypothetical protein KY319_03565 [Candidatus Woesearchaeota archaeon]|nr:hypothetical protein [Candidatus Woesearchaeota archaeon]